MKQTFMKIAVVLAVSVFSISVKSQQANVDIQKEEITYKDNTFKVNVETIGESAFKLTIENPGAQRLDIIITDKAGNVLVDLTTTKKTYICRYDFKDVEDGKYVINIAGKKEKIVKEFELNTVTIQSRNINVE